MERRFLMRIAARQEESEYKNLHSEQLIGVELLSDLAAENSKARARAEASVPLDLGLSTRDLVAQFPMFSNLSDAAIEEIAKLSKPRFAVPGEQLIRKGDRGTAVYFVSSGALEVDVGGTRLRLGRGDFAGELALLYNTRRSADVTTLGYCQLLVLEADAFHRFLDQHPEIRETVTKIGAERAKDMDPALLAPARVPKPFAFGGALPVDTEAARPKPKLRLSTWHRWRAAGDRDSRPSETAAADKRAAGDG
jgi:CPA1 family monovalent cation:H+ antiporter